MQTNRQPTEVEITRRKLRASGAARAEEASREGGVSPILVGLVAMLAVGMGVWAIISSRKVSILELALQRSRQDNEALSKNLAAVTVERDDLAKEKDGLAKELAALKQPPAEALNQMLSGLFPGMAAGSSGPPKVPVGGYTKSGRRVTISDGGGSALLGGLGGMSPAGMGGMPMMDPSQAMSQAMAMASAMQQESARRFAEPQPDAFQERPPEIQPAEPPPALAERNQRKAIDSMIDRQTKVFAGQFGLSPDQQNKTEEAMRAVAPGLWLYEKYRGGGGLAEGGAQGQETDAEKQERIAQEAQDYRRSSDLFARSMKEILTEKQFPNFQKWKKRRDEEFEATIVGVQREARRSGG